MKGKLVASLFLLASPLFAAGPGKIAWQPWSDDVFQRATREKKLVILDLEAVWCHWCHVMDEKTYLDPKVAEILDRHYLAVKVDQATRPDLANRYADYGWPATIVFASDGKELAKRSGYLAPEIMASMLQAFVDEPTPGPSVEPEAAVEISPSPFLETKAREELLARFYETYDQKAGSWGTLHKFLDWDSVDFTLAEMRRVEDGGKLAAMARQTCDGELNLVDPAFGGVYQYSTGGVWTEPHFEKIMQFQTENVRILSLAAATLREPRYLDAALGIRSFLRDFLVSPEGAFYTSMDADLVPGEHAAEYFALDRKARTKRGVPRIDKHVFARENGWAITALAGLYAYGADLEALAMAERAARWTEVHRGIAATPGGYRHDAEDAGGPFLGDTLAMGRAFLELYAVTGTRTWLAQAESAAGFMLAQFRRKVPGMVTAPAKGAAPFAPSVLRDENVAAARFLNLLHHYTGKAAYKDAASECMRFLASPQMREAFVAASILLVDSELGAAPIHITVVGRKDDPAAQALFRAALAYPVGYKRTEWWDKREGPLADPSVSYPELKQAAAFACSTKRCSLPAFKVEDIPKRIDGLR